MEVKEDSVCVLRGLGASKRGRKRGRTSPPFSYTWVCSLSGARDPILHSLCQKVGKALPSPGVPALLPHRIWAFLTGGLSVPGGCAGVPC